MRLVYLNLESIVSPLIRRYLNLESIVSPLIRRFAICVRSVTYIHEKAKFIDANTVEAGGKQYTGDHILIAAGGEPFAPPIEVRANLQ